MKKLSKKLKYSSEFECLIADAIGSGLFPGCALAVSCNERARFSSSWGRLSFVPWSPEVSASRTFFDLASLTKPLATACAIITLASQGILNIDECIGNIFNNIQTEKACITVRQLLSHSAGLAAHVPFYSNWLASTKKGSPPSISEIVATITESPLEYQPGTRSIYSDLGFMLLAAIIEKVSGMPYTRYVRESVLLPLGAHDILGPSAAPCTERDILSFAPTGFCPFERKTVQGEVNDLNARAGFHGHAGLFATADSLLSMLETLLDIFFQKKEVENFDPELLARFWTQKSRVSGSTWALGFDTPSTKNSSAGKLFSVHSVGHLGFTGTSFWIDIEKRIIVVFLSNRTFPSATSKSQEEMKGFRPRLHDAVMKMLL